MRPLQMAGVPDRVARQDLADGCEHHAIAGIAAEVLLSVDAAIVLAHRRVAHPPPARCDGLAWIGHREHPSLLSAVAVRQSTDRLKSLERLTNHFARLKSCLKFRKAASVSILTRFLDANR
jgi:hypothetical protein